MTLGESMVMPLTPWTLPAGQYQRTDGSMVDLEDAGQLQINTRSESSVTGTNWSLTHLNGERATEAGPKI